ncbi:G surface protein, allelic form 156 [Drosophila erecta]|uniref:Uncharacterized protein, isoform A n=1 Tax=Drosophila erecta TaxID=7220 RepID=B3NBM6_DROER|nr:G surface protein, allelic form 156 [Drosophila erecta]EDV50622.1 uncharacterized protein Dere_GG14353, isoform A [Drosophila erecta]
MLRLLIVLVFCILGCQAACNTCNTNGVSCISETEFQFCSSASEPIGSLYTCPTGYYCTESTPICSSVASSAGCAGCNKCSTDNRFACTGRNSFALCLGSSTPSTSIGGSCGTDYVCNVENSNICGSPTTYAVSCSGSSAPNCDSTTITDATEYCRSIQTAGKYPYGGVTSTTCRQYVNCFTAAGIFYGNVYTCPGHTYFDSTSKLCTTQTQARCSDTVSCLTLNDRLLP